MDDLAISKNSIHPEQTEIIMYQTEDGLTKIDVRMENETVWLTQAQMAELFQRERSGITKHIKNVFEEKNNEEDSFNFPCGCNVPCAFRRMHCKRNQSFPSS